MGKCVSRYIGTKFVGHCTAKHLIDCMNYFEEKLNWNENYLLQIGMHCQYIAFDFEGKRFTEKRERDLRY